MRKNDVRGLILFALLAAAGVTLDLRPDLQWIHLLCCLALIAYLGFLVIDGNMTS